jgi:hypothetical protein
MSANETQVDGDHYKGQEYQHWDFAIDARLPYIEGQITKYVDRYERKNGRADLRKALHNAEKLREAAVEGRVFPVGAFSYTKALSRYFEARPNQHIDDRKIIDLATIWTSSAHLDDLIAALKDRIVSVYGA